VGLLVGLIVGLLDGVTVGLAVIQAAAPPLAVVSDASPE
jgi:hypothetical protein